MSVAAKLPVDLTTPMLSSLDQVSKLTGTILICVSMAFLYPSIGANKTSESIANMASLSIFVITVIVNICIQMSTGVIFSFIPEHVIVMFFMLILLCLLWGCTLNMNEDKDTSMMENKKNLFANGKGLWNQTKESMLNRLKSCYLYAFSINPQLFICYHESSFVTCVASFFCLVIVLQVVFRSLIKEGGKFFSTSSDYGWSMRMIVGSQLILIILCSFATSARGVLMARSTQLRSNSHRKRLERHPCFSFSVKDRFSEILQLLVYNGFVIICSCCCIPRVICSRQAIKVMRSWCEKYVCSCDFLSQTTTFDDYDDCRIFVHPAFILDMWTLKNSWDDMKTLMKKRNNSSSSHLRQLLLEYPHSDPIVPSESIFSCVQVVCLVRIASVSIPSLGNFLTEILKEVFDVLYFVERTLNPFVEKTLNPNLTRFPPTANIEVAKALWMGKDFSIFLSKIPERSQSQTDLERAIQIINEISKLTSSLSVQYDVSIITGHIVWRNEYRSLEDLKRYMKKLFAHMLHKILIRLPEAIIKEISEGPVEDFEKNVRYVLSLLCAMEPLDGVIPWVFPVEMGITCMTIEISSTSGNVANVISTSPTSNVSVIRATEGAHLIVDNIDNEEIVEVEVEVERISAPVP